MEPAARNLARILELLEGFGVEVRAERLGGSGGGLCLLRGRHVFYLDLDADEVTREESAIRALAEMPQADATYLPPAIRERVEREKARRAGGQ
jgi:hypothetical protein